MDVANIDESERAPCSAADSPGKHSIGIAWNVPQTPHYDPEQAGPTPGGALGQGGARVRASPRARSRPNERSHGAMQAGSVAGPGKNPTCQ